MSASLITPCLYSGTSCQSTASSAGFKLSTEYIIAGGKPKVRLKSAGEIQYRGAYTGVAILLFHWIQQGKTQAWRFDPSIQSHVQSQKSLPTKTEAST